MQIIAIFSEYGSMQDGAHGGVDSVGEVRGDRGIAEWGDGNSECEIDSETGANGEPGNAEWRIRNMRHVGHFAEFRP